MEGTMMKFIYFILELFGIRIKSDTEKKLDAEEKEIKDKIEDTKEKIKDLEEGGPGGKTLDEELDYWKNQ